MRQFPERWIIKGTLTTTSPMHIGTGATCEDDRLQYERGGIPGTSELNLIIRDVDGKPCIPGSALKGVLRHYAKDCKDCGVTEAIFQLLFGDLARSAGSGAAQHADHHAGRVQFRTATFTTGPAACRDSTTRDALPHGGMPHFDETAVAGINTGHARDRATGTVVAQKLFHDEVVPAHTKFDLELRASHLNKEQVQVLLGLLEGFNKDKNNLSIGAGGSSGQGRLAWKCLEQLQLTADDATKWWKKQLAGDGDSDWAKAAKACELKAVLLSPTNAPIAFKAAITIDGPFLVHSGTESKKGEPDFRPRRTQDGRVELPGRSLHGALRAQAERICRTLGLEVPEGHKVQPLTVKTPPSMDIVSWLFGAPGWKSILHCPSFFASGSEVQHEQEFVAIDRFHGGASSGAKFRGESILSPTLVGSIGVDLKRLKNKNNDLVDAALGLLLLTLRDLDEGDIPLGYGAAGKGYGQIDMRHTKTRTSLAKELPEDKPETACITAFRNHVKSRRSDEALPDRQTDALRVANGQLMEPFPITEAVGEFHNPYAFIPVSEPSNLADWVPVEEFRQRDKILHHWHDRYAPKDKERNSVYSGRIICTLETRTPLVIGGKQTPRGNDPTTVFPFRLGSQEAGEIAIPSTSLRGMIGSLVEAASQSTLRVLTPTPLSVRQTLGNNSLSAIGRIVWYLGEPRLEPLSLPTMRINGNTQNVEIPADYRTMFGEYEKGVIEPPVKALFGDWHNAEAGTSNFVACHIAASLANPLGPSLYCLPYQTFWFKDFVFNYYAHLKSSHDSNGHFLGHRVAVNSFPIRYALGQNGSIGYVRVMQSAEAERDLPSNRRHEVFVTCPVDNPADNLPSEFRDNDGPAEEQEQLRSNYLKYTYVVPPEVIARFELLADERTSSQDNKDNLSETDFLPYHPLGTRRNKGNVKSALGGFKRLERALRIKPGDLVFFRPDSNNLAIVGEISFSACWRSAIEIEANGQPQIQTPRDFFGRLSPELVPFNRSRKQISPAEWILGFTDNGSDPDPENARPEVLAFAGKLRFSFGRTHEEHPPEEQPKVRLKILASPKLPSPAMYFNHRSRPGQYVSKSELAVSAADYCPKGRKVYLPAWRDGNGQGRPIKLNKCGEPDQVREEPWESQTDPNDKNNNQRVSVTPIKATGDKCFWFHIDFENLNQEELKLLCFSLQPDVKFEHRLGMGKSLGLGSVKIAPQALLLTDRVGRYAHDGCGDPRYHAAWTEKPTMRRLSIPDRYATCMASITAKDYSNPASVADLGASGAKRVPPDVLRAIVITGNPGAVKKPVHTPQLAGRDIEVETYGWFVRNDKSIITRNPANHRDTFESIGTIDETTIALPALKRTPG